MGGPGWAEYPNVAILGGPTGLEKSVDASVLDQRCALYAPVYLAGYQGH